MTNYLFYDTETSGFIPKNFNQSKTQAIEQPWICQMGMLLSDGETDYNRMSFLIKSEDRKISPGAEKVHGISIEMCEKGIPERSAAELFYFMVSKADVIVCHNTAFDIPMTTIMLKRIGNTMLANDLQKMDSICTMKSTTDYCAIPAKWGFKWPKLQELHKKLFGFEFEGAHDALTDVEATKRCFFELKERNII